MQRGQVGQLAQLILHGRCYPDRRGEQRAAVHDPVADGVRCGPAGEDAAELGHVDTSRADRELDLLLGVSPLV